MSETSQFPPEDTGETTPGEAFGQKANKLPELAEQAKRDRHAEAISNMQKDHAEEVEKLRQFGPDQAIETPRNPEYDAYITKLEAQTNPKLSGHEIMRLGMEFLAKQAEESNDPA